MKVFDTHRQIVDDYDRYIRSFINIADPEIAQKVEDSLSEGRLWPAPLLQFNPAYEQAGTVEEVIASGYSMRTPATSLAGTPCTVINARPSHWVWSAPTSS